MGSLYGATATGLYQLWYKDYPMGGFRWINDNAEWMQMDKIGHAYSAYQEARWGHYLLKEYGLEDNKAMWWSAGLGLAFQSSIEVFDGMSKQWGASWGDLAANVAGSALILTQHQVWQEQKILMKFSYHPTRFAPRRPNTLGGSHVERVLKDYNGQTYWLSFNLHSFSTKEDPKIFPWLNVAIGYSGDGMLGGTSNVFLDGNGQLQDYSLTRRQRQLFVALDLDLSRIETNKKWKKVALFFLNSLKVPAPTLIINGKTGIDSRILYF
jgi:uncharacterized protein YfiM (DUF2279 family)